MHHCRFKIVLIAVLAAVMVVGRAATGEDRFVDNGDGTVTDLHTELMWAATDNHGDINWQQAVQWTRFTFSNTIPVHYDGWRLPTMAELKSLYRGEDDAYDGYETDCGQRVLITPAIRLTCGWIWAEDNASVTATVFNFTRGIHYTERKVHSRAHRVLPVRNID
ncbi:MAG: DUF1566 domain-containing protein [Desulfobacterales bacterium]|jgi:hypothetical protein